MSNTSNFDNHLPLETLGGGTVVELSCTGKTKKYKNIIIMVEADFTEKRDDKRTTLSN